jgi:hypothetical protein
LITHKKCHPQISHPDPVPTFHRSEMMSDPPGLLLVPT